MINDEDKKMMVELIKGVSGLHKPEIVHDENNNVLVEKPYCIKFKGKTACYCTSKEDAEVCRDAFLALGEMMGVMLATTVFGKKLDKSCGEPD